MSDTSEGPDVDSTGVTVEGDSFKDIHEFREYLLGKEDQLARNLTERLITFSTGTGVTFADRELVEEILNEDRTFQTRPSFGPERDRPQRCLPQEVTKERRLQNI